MITIEVNGKPAHRLDTPAKTNGSAVFGGRLVSFDAEQAKAIKGVRQVFQTEDGVAVLADGFWRSVGNSQNGFATESFIDDLVAEKGGWDGKLPPGCGRGVAVVESFSSYVAEVEVGKDKSVAVKRVTCAIDCGSVVNPDTVRAQIESAVVYALTAAIKGPIAIRGGRVEQSNFPDYPLLRLDEMPIVEVHILPSSEPPGGVGEPGVPPLAPAVANAVFAATGQRLRRPPISLQASNDSVRGMTACPRSSSVPAGDVVGLLLAAGNSTRFGTNKLSQPLPDGGEWVAIRACRNLSRGVDRVVAVVRHGHDTLASELDRAGAEVVVCENAGQGMSASLVAGIAHASEAAGWLIALADMPWIKPGTVAAVATAIRQGAAMAAPTFEGRRGHPAGFSCAYRESLLGLSGDHGARDLLRDQAGQLQLIPSSDPGVLIDIDTPGDLRCMEWTSRHGETASPPFRARP